MKIAFILQSLEHAGMRKRVRILEKLGVTPTVLGFERPHQMAKQLSEVYTSLGILENKLYWKRAWHFVRAISRVRASAKTVDVLYAFGLDLLLLGWLATRFLSRPPRLVYEVRDVHAVLTGNSAFSAILRWLERRLVKDTWLIVATSPLYVSEYLKGWQHLSRAHYLVIENKLETPGVYRSEVTRLPMQDGVLCIGYFGVLRCTRSWEILKRLAEKGKGRVRVYVRGIPLRLPNLIAEAQAAPYIEYGGPYKAPADLPTIYAQVDLAWVGYGYYNSRVANWRWARTNRYYDSCCFGKPMLAQMGTEDGRLVDLLGLGMTVDLSNVEETVDRILSVTSADIERWTNNVRHLPEETYLYTDEHQRLLDCLSQ